MRKPLAKGKGFSEVYVRELVHRALVRITNDQPGMEPAEIIDIVEAYCADFREAERNGMAAAKFLIGKPSSR